MFGWKLELVEATMSELEPRLNAAAKFAGHSGQVHMQSIDIFRRQIPFISEASKFDRFETFHWNESGYHTAQIVNISSS